MKKCGNNPHPFINNVTKSLTPSSDIDFYYELAKRKLSKSIRGYFLSASELFGKLPRALNEYIQKNSKNGILDKKVIREIKAVIDLSKECEEDICLNLLAHIRFGDDLSKAALVAIKGGQSEVVPTLLNLNTVQNIQDLKLVRRIVREDELSLENRNELLEKARKNFVSSEPESQKYVSPNAGVFAFSIE